MRDLRDKAETRLKNTRQIMRSAINSRGEALLHRREFVLEDERLSEVEIDREWNWCSTLLLTPMQYHDVMYMHLARSGVTCVLRIDVHTHRGKESTIGAGRG